MQQRDEGENRVEPARPALEWTMLVLALLMVPIVIIQESSNDAEVLTWTERLSAGIWIAFVAEYVYLLRLADHKLKFVQAHWFDLLIIALTPPVAFLPSEFEALRALRALRIVRLIAVLGRANHTLRRFLGRDSLPYVAALPVFVVLLGGLMIHAIEPQTAETVGDGLWWAAATLTTVGYGDIAPTTLAGRVLAVVIMVLGISTFAILTASIASVLVRPEQRAADPELAAVRGDLAEIKEQLAGIAKRLDRTD